MGMEPSQSQDRSHLEGDRYAAGWMRAKAGGDPSVELLIHPELDRLVGAAVQSGGKTLLDAGCGDGSRSLFLLTRFPELKITAGDYNQQLVVQAVANLPTANVAKLDLGVRFPYEPASFDALICVNVLMHLDDQQMANAAKEAVRVLGEGRQAFFVTVHSDWAKAMKYPIGTRGQYWRMRPDIPGGKHEEHYPTEEHLTGVFTIDGATTVVNRLVIPERQEYIKAGFPNDSKLDRHCSFSGTALFSCVTMTKTTGWLDGSFKSRT